MALQVVNNCQLTLNLSNSIQHLLHNDHNKINNTNVTYESPLVQTLVKGEALVFLGEHRFLSPANYWNTIEKRSGQSVAEERGHM